MTTGHIDDDEDNKQSPAQLPLSGVVHMLIDSESKRKEDADTRHRYHPSRALPQTRTASASAASAAAQSADSKEEKQPGSPLSPSSSSPVLSDSDSDKENLPFSSSSAASSSPPSSSLLLPPRRFRPFFLHEWLDVRDAEGVWLEAQVIGLTAERLQVHYKGYKKKYDEWLPLAPSDPEAARIAPLHQHTRPRYPLPDRTVVPLSELCSSSPPLPLPIDCLDTTDKWLPAYMIAFDRSTCLCLVRYEGWSAVYNEWLPVDSYRIAPRRSHSTASDSLIVNIKPMEDDAVAPSSFTSCSLTAAQQHRRKSEYAASLDSEGRFRLKLLQHLGLEVVEQGSDGNCLFRAVSHQLYDSSEHHAVVRDRCVSYLQQEAAYFRAFVVGDWDAYVLRMRQQGEWGDHLEIQAMSEVYDMPIEIYAYSLHPLRTYRGEGAAGGEAGRGRGVMRLSYHFASHYNSVVEAGRRGGLLRAQLPGMVEDDMIEKRRRRREEAQARQRDERLQVQRGALRQEEEQLNRALDVSRSTFNAQSSLSDFDRAVAASMREMSDEEERKVEEVKRESEREELERDEMQAAIKQSEQEDEWQSIEQQQITAAMHDSLALNRPSSVSRQQAQHALPAASEDEDLKLALELSLAPSLPPAAAPSSSSLASSPSFFRPVSSSPTSSSLTSAPASSASVYPSAVRKLLDLGFPVDSCIAAYSLYEGTGGGEEALVQNMMDHMLNAQHRGAGDGAGSWD